LNQKQFALGVFLDIDGAFENASFGSMDAAIMGLFQPCVGGLMPCFAVEAFGSSTVPSVVEHGGRRPTL
jgi:hypothetical protein